jgi:peptidoglycan/LPS O-acetylase OafA/YrhL
MHSEHLTNLHIGWVIGGWFLAAVVTGAAYLALVGVGLAPAGDAAVLGLAPAMAVGFFAGGLVVGMRWCDAPILHGAAITFFSVLVWFAGSLALPGSMEPLEGPAPTVLGLVLLQLVAAVAGGWTGRMLTLRGDLTAKEEE